MNCRFAELNVTINNRGRYLARLCDKYIGDFTSPDFTIAVSDDDLANDPIKYPSKSHAESVIACRKLAYHLPEKDAFLLHAATFEVMGHGIAFIANSGTGKSTHMMLWRELFGKDLTVINGDKPIIRLKEGIPFAYGTPWCGKEGLSENRGVPLTDLCFIVRSEKAETLPLSPSEAISRLLTQIIIPSGSENILKLTDLLDKTVKKCRIWEIRCNTELSSAEISSKKILEVK